MTVLLGFLVMPFVTLPFFGSLSGVQLATHASDEGVLGLLWLVVPAGLGVAGIGGWQQFSTTASPNARRSGSGVIVGLCAAVVLVHVIILSVANNAIANSGAGRFGADAGSLTGAGFWIPLLAAVVAAIAATADLLGVRMAAPNQSGPAG